MNNVIAATLGLTPSELSEYRYQSTRTSQPIYAIGDNYYCQGKHQPKDIMGKPWKPYSDQFFSERANTIIWVSEILND